MAKSTPVRNSIRTVRFMHGPMTQAELAGQVTVTRQTVIAIEQGKYSPTLGLAFPTARVFDVPLDGVFQFDDGSGS